MMASFKLGVTLDSLLKEIAALPLPIQTVPTVSTSTLTKKAACHAILVANNVRK